MSNGMLSELENLLSTAITAAVPTGTKIVTGSLQPSEAPQLNIFASNLKIIADGSSEENRRNPAYFTQRHTFKTQRHTFKEDGKQLNFPLPVNLSSDILEVELSPGRLAKQGDDYQLASHHELHFYQPPSGAFSVLIHRKSASGSPAYFTQTFNGDGKTLNFSLPDDLSGDILEVKFPPERLAKQWKDYRLDSYHKLRFYQAPPGDFSVLIRKKSARGYQELSPCLVTLFIQIWCTQVNEADSLLSAVLAASLRTLSDLDRIELVNEDKVGFSLRLIKPLVELGNLERPTASTTTSAFCSSAQLLVRAELEMMLAQGASSPESLIKSIKVRGRKVKGQHKRQYIFKE